MMAARGEYQVGWCWVVLGCRVVECCSNVVEMWWKVKECLIKLMFLNWSCLLSSHDTSTSFFVSCY
jgi:hypothetical protein